MKNLIKILRDAEYRALRKRVDVELKNLAAGTGGPVPSPELSKAFDAFHARTDNEYRDRMLSINPSQEFWDLQDFVIGPEETVLHRVVKMAVDGRVMFKLAPAEMKAMVSDRVSSGFDRATSSLAASLRRQTTKLQTETPLPVKVADVSILTERRKTPRTKHRHYFRPVAHLDEIDIYRFLLLFDVTDPALAHAIKKLVAPGGRGAGKDFRKDVQEAIDTLQRRLEMLEEDDASVPVGS